MNRDNLPPQTVGEALANDWTYLRLRCALCRHAGQIELAPLPANALLADVIMRARCPRNCARGMVDVKIGWARISRAREAHRRRGAPHCEDRDELNCPAGLRYVVGGSAHAGAEQQSTVYFGFLKSPSRTLRDFFMVMGPRAGKSFCRIAARLCAAR